MRRQVRTVLRCTVGCVPSLADFVPVLTVLVALAFQEKQLTNGNLRLDSTENLVSVSTCVVRLTKDCVKNRKVGYSADNPARFRLTLISSRCGNRLWCVRALHLVEERYGKLASGSWMETQANPRFSSNSVLLQCCRVHQATCDAHRH